jgi:hypothetical protein
MLCLQPTSRLVVRALPRPSQTKTGLHSTPHRPERVTLSRGGRTRLTWTDEAGRAARAVEPEVAQRTVIGTVADVDSHSTASTP